MLNSLKSVQWFSRKSILYRNTFEFVTLVEIIECVIPSRRRINLWFMANVRTNKFWRFLGALGLSTEGNDYYW